MRAGTIWRALEAARRDNLDDAGIPAPQTGSWAWSRRALLKALGGAGAAGLAGGGPAWALPSRPGRVAILGGGMAGLTALHHLRTHGVDARLYEARGRLGGRVHTRRTPEGAVFERGGQLVNTDHADMHALARRFGIALVDRKQAVHTTLVTANGRLIPETELAVALRPIAARIDADARALDADFDRVAPVIDRLSIAGYLDRHAALIGAPFVRRLLEQTARTEYGVEPHEASAIELLFNLPVVDGARVEVLGGSDERFVIEGGSDRLVAALAAAHRDAIRTGHRAVRVAPAGDGLGIHFADGREVRADHLLVAVPAPLTRTIRWDVPLTPQWRDFIGRMATGRNEKLQWAMTSAPWRAAMGEGGEAWSADPASPAALAWDGTVRGGNEVPTWTWFQGGAQAGCDPDALAAGFAAVQPGLAGLRRSGTADRTDWSRDPLARGAYVNFRPGELTRFAPLLWLEHDDPAERQVARAGPVVFAGEHLSDAFPGYMNGAAQTGRLAAEALLGRRVRAEDA